MRIFVAGAGGVIGRRLVPLLVGRGHAVTALTRRPERAAGLRALGAEPVVADAYDAAALAAAVSAARPEVVVHQLTDLAAADTAANARLRIHGTGNLVDAARAAGVRQIVTQSVAWAYQPGPAPADEAAYWPSGPVNVCDDEPAAARDWVPAFCAAVGAPPPPTREGRAPWARGADNRHAGELGWTPGHPTWRGWT
jgi:nucleoside-diphosphate-sugar epimerase